MDIFFNRIDSFLLRVATAPRATLGLEARYTDWTCSFDTWQL